MRAALLLVASTMLLAAADKPSPTSPDPNTPRPIEAVDTVFLEDMTWMEIRDAMKAGKKTVIVATGGIEQNGPYLAANKHQVVLKATTDAMARKLGNALVAPLVGFVPEGNLDPPTSHMKYPSTVGVTEETYRALIRDICTCYKTHGFETIVLIGDSGDNQKGLAAVADELTKKWTDGSTRVVYVPEYYNYGEVAKWLESQGIKQEPEGLHDDFAITAMMMSVDPGSVRASQRIAAGKFSINGVNLAPQEKTAEWGRKIAAWRADAAIQGLQAALKK